MPPADKRARKKENARAAREQREAALRRKKRMRSAVTVGIVTALFVGLIVILSVAGGGDKKKKATTTSTTTTPVVLPAGCVKTVPPQTKKPTYKAAPAMTIDTTKTYVAHFTTTCGAFDVTLDPKEAPKTVNNFVFLVEKHFYDGLKFHRVAKDFVVQGGDPQGNGFGGPGYDMPIEPPKNGYKEGSVAMAGSASTASGSQFFLTLSATGAQGLGTTAPYGYSILGDVTKGFDVVKKLGTLYNPDQNPQDPGTQKTSAPLYMFTVTITSGDEPAGATTSGSGQVGATTTSSAAVAPSVSTSPAAPAR